MILLVSYVAGGLVLFLYGMRLASDGLREAAGGRLKAVLSVLTSRRSTGVLVGIVVTFLLSSSSAVSVLLVELANAGLISLRQAILVLLGATVGTALTVQIIDVVLSQYLPRLKPAELGPDALEVKSKLLYIIKDIEAIADLATCDFVRIGWENRSTTSNSLSGKKRRRTWDAIRWS
jgi:phosphate:Na+ symporter